MSDSPACRAAALLARLEGRWELSRDIDDRRAGELVRFVGEAVFEARAGAGLVYREAGELRMPGRAPLRAERSYLWEVDAAGVAVRFADGRAFHGFDPGEARDGGTTAAHSCPPDVYGVRYCFEAWPVWRSVWDVSGPRKDYRMVSVYRPV